MDAPETEGRGSGDTSANVDDANQRGKQSKGKQSRKRAEGKKVSKPFKLNVDDPAALLRELGKQRSAAAQIKELRIKALNNDLTLITAQICKVQFDITHGSRISLNTTRHASNNIEELLRSELERLQKQAKLIATALRHDDLSGVRDMIQAVDTLFRQQRKELREAQIKVVEENKNKIAKAKRAHLMSMDDTSFKHAHSWRPCGRSELSTVPVMAMEPNPGGKAFDMTTSDLWPVMKQGNGWGPAKNKSAPWRQVTSGRTFGEAPLETLGPNNHKWLLKRKQEHIKLAKQKDDELRRSQAPDPASHKGHMEVWKCAPSAPGKLFATCKPNRPLTYYERIKAIMMCQPDRVTYRTSDDGKPPWLPTRNGELFMPISAMTESSSATLQSHASITFDGVYRHPM